MINIDKLLIKTHGSSVRVEIVFVVDTIEESRYWYSYLLSVTSWFEISVENVYEIHLKGVFGRPIRAIEKVRKLFIYVARKQKNIQLVKELRKCLSALKGAVSLL